MQKRYLAGGICAAAIAGLYLLNASWLAPAPAGQPRLLAHRGVYQRYDRTGLTNETCTASRIFKPTTDLLENTLPSMQAAINDGADVVEIDIHPTTDSQFVVFHDWTVDCRTDGHGATRDHSLAELKALDIGYGYTWDGGKTFPFRGRFKGQMPSLKEALDAMPGTTALLNFKSNDPAEADRLVTYLGGKDGPYWPRVMAYGGDRPVAELHKIAPDVPTFSKATLKSCGFTYMALGWTGYLPKACHNTILFLPQNYTWLAWGYPNRLQQRFHAANSYIYLLGPQQGKAGLAGINTPDQLAKVPPSWRMGILTDEIESIGPLVSQRADKKL